MYRTKYIDTYMRVWNALHGDSDMPFDLEHMSDLHFMAVYNNLINEWNNK